LEQQDADFKKLLQQLEAKQQQLLNHLEGQETSGPLHAINITDGELPGWDEIESKLYELADNEWLLVEDGFAELRKRHGMFEETFSPCLYFKFVDMMWMWLCNDKHTVERLQEKFSTHKILNMTCEQLEKHKWCKGDEAILAAFRVSMKDNAWRRYITESVRSAAEYFDPVIAELDKVLDDARAKLQKSGKGSRELKGLVPRVHGRRGGQQNKGKQAVGAVPSVDPDDNTCVDGNQRIVPGIPLHNEISLDRIPLHNEISLDRIPLHNEISLDREDKDDDENPLGSSEDENLLGSSDDENLLGSSDDENLLGSPEHKPTQLHSEHKPTQLHSEDEAISDPEYSPSGSAPLGSDSEPDSS
jgi:hypothetical protein